MLLRTRLNPKRAVIVAGFCLCFCRPGPLHPQILPFDHYSLKNGLTSTWTNSIFQDSRGYLWIGGDEGVSVYDGVRFKNYGVRDGLPVSQIWCVYESQKSPGAILIGTHGAGLVTFEQGRFTTMKLDTLPGSNTVGAMLEDYSGVLWCGTNAGVYRVQNGSSTFFPTDSVRGWVPFIVQTSDSLIWISTERKLYRYSPRSGETQLLNLHVEPSLLSCMNADAEGNIWLGGYTGDIYQMRNDQIIAARQLPTEELFDMIDDGEGSLWFVAMQGIFKVSKHDFTGAFTQYTVENGLHENRLISCLRDRENNFWFGGRTKGLAKLSERNLVTFPFEGVRPDVMSRVAVADARGRFFLLSESGVWEIWRQRHGNWQKHLHQLERGDLTGLWWQADFGADSTLWICFDKGGMCGYQIHANGEQHSRLTLKRTLQPGRDLPAGFPIAFLVDDYDQLWCSMRGEGIAHYDLRTSTPRAFYSMHEGLASNTIRAIWRDRNEKMWFGSYNLGISIFRPVAGKYEFERKLTMAEGLLDDGIRMIFEHSNGEIWIATRFGGIAIVDGERMITLSTRDGLLSDAVWGFTEDALGRIWIATSLGMQYVLPDSSYKLVTPQGLGGQFFGSIGAAPGQMIWGMGYHNLVIYEYGRKSKLNIPPPIYITNLRVNGKNRNLIAPAEFAYDENLCTIEFSGISFKDETAVRYRHRLHGLHEEWQEPTEQRVVTFASLRPGTYTFEVIAINAEGAESATPAALTFTIQPPFWQRWWFIALCLLLLGTILYAIHVVRLDRVLEIEKIRSRIALDLHDEIGAGLTHIGLLSQVALHKKNVQQFYDAAKARLHHPEAGEAQETTAALYELGGALERVGGIARELSAAMGDVVWSINPKHDSVEALQRRLKSFAHEICHAKNIALNFDVSKALAGMKLHPETRRNLLLIAKEALHNMAKYSGSPSVEVKIDATTEKLRVVIQDCGKGFDLAHSSTGNGLNNMRLRAEKLGGTCEIISAPGQGTQIVASAPYKI
ncbi:hypothetical protein HUU40_06615 [candidate division KSB1 bacterium]|nr:hypothetical protein [candidate division KSB1 bacterium]